MSILDNVGKVFGGAAGTAFGGPLGGLIGSTLGGKAGGLLENLVGGGKLPQLTKLLGGNLGPFGGALGSLIGKNMPQLMGCFAPGAIRNSGQLHEQIIGRIEFALERFGPGALPFLGCQPRSWPFPNMQPPQLPFCPVGPGCVQVPSPGQTKQPGLTTNGQGQIDTGRYQVDVKDDEVKVYDKETKSWLKAWGDPHLETGDGDKGQFHENLTIQLEDGTKLTIKTTPKDANGIAFIDAVAVMKGDQAVVVNGVHDGKEGVQMGNVLNNSRFVDSAWEDGTVLVSGHQVDDLTFAADGKEIIGTDPNARWNEHNLDGRGGAPKTSSTDGANGTGGAGSSSGANGAGNSGGTNGVGNDFGIEPGDTLEDKLFKILTKLQEKLEGKPQPDGKPDPNSAIGKLDSLKEGDDAGMKKAMYEIQKLQNMISQVFQSITNIQKSNDDTKEAIVRNFA